MNTVYTRVSNLHWPLIAVTILIFALGIYNLHSSSAARDPDLYLTQLYWGLFGIALIAGLLVFDYRLTEHLAYVIYAIVCLLLLAVLVQGKAAGGARRWLVLGPMTFQPSEIAKIATILAMARYFSHRIDPRGYTIRSLFRPLNPSRPLAVVIVLATGWSKPWLVDPLGELARFIYAKIPEPPAPADLLWLRGTMAVLLLLTCVLVIVLIFRFEKEFALLNPWPPKRRRRLVTLTIALFLSLGALLAFVWEAPVLRDPFGAAIAVLHAGASPGGVWDIPRPGYGLRALLLLGAAAYSIASVSALRRRVEQPLDIVLAPIDLLALPALLVLVEPDLGTSGIIILIGFTMILVVGVRLRSLIMLGIQGALLSGVAWFGVLKDYQKRRILTFIDPEHDIKGAGWNAIQSMIAVGSGRWWGKGHREGTQSQLSFLPEQHTDFAFSVWAEEQGFFGCALVLALYVLLLSFAFVIAANAREAYGALLAVGVGALILWQALINVGMVIGVMPVVGLTLPMFSYGGSSLMTVLLGMGLLLNVHWRRRSY